MSEIRFLPTETEEERIKKICKYLGIKSRTDLIRLALDRYIEIKLQEKKDELEIEEKIRDNAKKLDKKEVTKKK